MLAVINRLRESGQIIRIVRRGRAFNGRHLRILFLPTPAQREASSGRYTVVVSKKISKRASTRNYLKRRTREALRASGLPSGLWGVIFPRLSAAEAPFAELVQDFTEWQRQIR